MTTIRNVSHHEEESTIMYEARTMPSLDTRLIKISSSDNSSPSSSDFIKVVLAEENRQYALKVLCETFSKVKPRSPPNPISSYAGLDNQSNPHSRMSTTTTAEDRNDNAVAPPLQLVNFSTLLKNTHPFISGRVVELSTHLRPRPGSISDDDSDVGSFDFAGDQQDLVDNDDQHIQSAQPIPPPPQQNNPRRTPPPDDGIDDRRELDADDVDVLNNLQEIPVEGEHQTRLHKQKSHNL